MLVLIYKNNLDHLLIILIFSHIILSANPCQLQAYHSPPYGGGAGGRASFFRLFSLHPYLPSLHSGRMLAMPCLHGGRVSAAAADGLQVPRR